MSCVLQVYFHAILLSFKLNDSLISNIYYCFIYTAALWKAL